MPRDRRHIVVTTPAEASPYSPHPKKIDVPPRPSPPDRVAHGHALRDALVQAAAEAAEARATSGIEVAGLVPGVTVRFDSQPEFSLELQSLDARSRGIELLSVIQDGEIQKASVFVPDGQVKYFVTKFEAYTAKETKKGKPQNQPLVESIAALQRATLRALWTDRPEAYPTDEAPFWWEVWLRRSDGAELDRLRQAAVALQFEIREGALVFDERLVVLVRATAGQLAASLDVLNEIAEARKAKESSTVLEKLPNEEQAEWAEELLERTTFAGEGAPSVCVIDTGVTREHPLISLSIDPGDAHTVDPNWGTGDDDGHGTEMSGTSLWGDLHPVLTSNVPVVLRHRLESVKILPPHGQPPHQPQHYGRRTAEAINRVEIAAPERNRVHVMAITADDKRDQGRPSAWSAAIDALASGRAFDPVSGGLAYVQDEEPRPRLIILAAGNVDSLEKDHVTRSELEPVRDPGQAWNALTVGAHTEMTSVDEQDESLAGHVPLAPAGELSPYSSTGVLFEPGWPLKPDIVMEGGNRLLAPGAGGAVQHDSLCLLSTNHRPAVKVFTPFWATSAASAQAARLAAEIVAEYPEFWPETVRAMVVHSAEWTARMRRYFKATTGKKQRVKLAQRYGFGVPSLDRALRSATNALTLIAQDTIRPYKNGNMHEMNLHALPWPVEALRELGETLVRLRITLSYFAEPNPGSRGWKRQHRYGSHGLRFEVKLPDETDAAFKKRVNRKALADDEDKPTMASDSDQWLLGDHARTKGSLHADFWEGTAADLADRGTIGIHPVSGWWKYSPNRDRSADGVRYALIVSIETEATHVDLWTPVFQQVTTLVPV